MCISKRRATLRYFLSALHRGMLADNAFLSKFSLLIDHSVPLLSKEHPFGIRKHSSTIFECKSEKGTGFYQGNVLDKNKCYT